MRRLTALLPMAVICGRWAKSSWAIYCKSGIIDLIEWRRDNDLNGHPAVIIASASLNFPMHNSLHEHGQTVYIATGRNADPERIRYWQDLGYSILITGEDRMVHGALLIHELRRTGLQKYLHDRRPTHAGHNGQG
jgi:hypothetical protein